MRPHLKVVGSQEGIRRVLAAQAILAAVTAAVFAVFHSLAAALAALYGGAITLASSALLARSVTRAATFAAASPGRGALVLYSGLAQRFLFAAVALAAGIAFYPRGALPALAGFAVAHLGFLASAKRKQGPGQVGDRT
jgi:F0F1-type ATP synthase assembly protein I